MPFMAAGRLGSAQRALVETALDELHRQGLFRVVLIHHPPLPGQAGWRRGLRDASPFARILRDKGAELVLHGHDHRQTVHEFPTATGPAIVVGVPSASEAVAGRIPAARYNEYRIERVKDGWSCEMVGRAVEDMSALVWECERRMLRES